MFGYSETKCWNCKTVYWVPDALNEAMERTKNGNKRVSCFCPYGHEAVRKSDAKKTEEEKIRNERDRLKQQLAYKDDLIREKNDQIDHERRSANAYKGKVTRLKNRAQAGMCSCCNRHFENLERHMKTKHPNEHKEHAA